MRHTYTCLLFHVVLSTRHREPFLGEVLRERLFGYMGGIAVEKRGRLIAAGGVEDHVHLLVESPATLPLSEMIQSLKGSTSRWINDNELCTSGFGWQRGYSAFSVSRSSLERVRGYLERQVEHHGEQSYDDELQAFYKLHGIEPPKSPH